MSVSYVGPEDLLSEIEQRVLEMTREMWDAVMAPGCSAAEAEERVVELTRQVGREVLSAGLSERYGRHSGRYRPCACGQQQRFEGYRPREVTTMLGPVTYRRAYYRCARCRASHFAGEDALGLQGSSFSLPAQEAITLLSSEVPFERARVLLGRLTGIAVSVSHAEHLSRAHGQRIEEGRAAECAQLFEGSLEYLPPARDHRLYVTLDATKARYVDDWHEARVGAVYDGTPGRDRMDEPGETTYVAHTAAAGLEVFGQALYQEAALRGVEHARETVAVADGAPWIWNLVAEHFPHATQILDFYHASERLHEVARAVYGEGTQEAKQWAERNVQRLSAGDWKGLLCSLNALHPRTRDGTEVVRRCIGYLETNRQRMDYPAYRARGMHIGSGVVEAACKCVVGTRCKRSGMRWTETGLAAILATRPLLLNDRWDEYWKPLKAAA